MPTKFEHMLGGLLSGKQPNNRDTGPSMTTLRRRAAKLGVTIDIERDQYGMKYWLTGDVADKHLEDMQFCTSRDEIDGSLQHLAAVLHPAS